MPKYFKLDENKTKLDTIKECVNHGKPYKVIDIITSEKTNVIGTRKIIGKILLKWIVTIEIKPKIKDNNITNSIDINERNLVSSNT